MKSFLRRILFPKRVQRELLCEEAMHTMMRAWFYLWDQYHQFGVVKETSNLFPEHVSALNILCDADRAAFDARYSRA